MKRLTGYLYFWVLLAIIAGGTFGYLEPQSAVMLKPLGDGFIALVKMLISPVIFCTVVLGISGAGDMKKVGRVGGKALIYFEVVSTLALCIAMVVMHILKPGKGFNVDPATLDTQAVADYARAASSQSTLDFVLHIIPKTFTDAFTGAGGLLQVLFVAILFGYAMLHLGPAGKTVHLFIEECSRIFFAMMAATLAVVPSLPVAGLALILGIDRFMSEARSLTNFVGNGVATVVVSGWENEPDRKRMQEALGG